MNRKTLFFIACVIAFAGSAGITWLVTKRKLEHARKVKEDAAITDLKEQLDRKRIVEKARLQEQLDELDSRITEQQAKAAEVEKRWKARETVIDESGDVLIPEAYVRHMLLYVGPVPLSH